MNSNCNIQWLIDHFYNLALRGRGHLSRGKYFFALHLLEFAIGKKLTTHGPRAKPHLWLKLVFDVVNDYFHGYAANQDSGVSEENLKLLIQKELEQPWQDFITKVQTIGKEVNWENIAQMIDRAIKRYLKRKKLESGSLSLYLGPEELAELDVNAMRVADVFCWLPELVDESKPKDRTKHESGRTLVKTLQALLSEPWFEVINEHSKIIINANLLENKKSMENDRIPLLVYLFGCLPPSGITLVNIISDYLKKTYNKFPKGYKLSEKGKIIEEEQTYSFVVFYILISNSPSKSYGRHWEPSSCYRSEWDEVDFEMLFDVGDKKVSTRPLELVHLGLSSIFPQVITIFDRWLENCDGFSELHGNQAWYVSLEEHIDRIDSLQSSVWEAVILKIRKTSDN